MVSFHELLRSIVKSRRQCQMIMNDVGEDEMTTLEAIDHLKRQMQMGNLPIDSTRQVIRDLEENEDEEEEEEEEEDTSHFQMMVALYPIAKEREPAYAAQLYERMKNHVEPAISISERIVELGYAVPERIVDLFEIGRAAKQNYIEDYGEAPPKVERVIRGKKRQINKYTRDRIGPVDDAINEFL